MKPVLNFLTAPVALLLIASANYASGHGLRSFNNSATPSQTSPIHPYLPYSFQARIEITSPSLGTMQGDLIKVGSWDVPYGWHFRTNAELIIGNMTEDMTLVESEEAFENVTKMLGIEEGSDLYVCNIGLDQVEAWTDNETAVDVTSGNLLSPFTRVFPAITMAFAQWENIKQTSPKVISDEGLFEWHVPKQANGVFENATFFATEEGTLIWLTHWINGEDGLTSVRTKFLSVESLDDDMVPCHFNEVETIQEASLLESFLIITTMLLFSGVLLWVCFLSFKSLVLSELEMRMTRTNYKNLFL